MNQDTNQAKTKMSNIQIFTFNPTQENTYVISDDTKSCVIIDPGCYYPEEKKELFDYIKENINVNVKANFSIENYIVDIIHDKKIVELENVVIPELSTFIKSVKEPLLNPKLVPSHRIP
jgi:hypothetical protein